MSLNNKAHLKTFIKKLSKLGDIFKEASAYAFR